MKGKATIILSDAKTGRVVKQLEEHNLVTNAISNIFNPPHDALVHGFDYSTLFTKGLPMWKELLGGIMLLGNTETEDVDNILLGKDIIPVGAAGSNYSGSCVTRGSLNLNESYKTEKGYHFTWDFGTDKANGTIRCVALTSKTFGNTGFGSVSSDSRLFIAPDNIGGSGTNSSMTLEYGAGQYIGCYEDGMHLFIRKNSDGDLDILRYKSIDVNALLINNTAGLSALSTPVSKDTVKLGLNIPYEDRFFLDVAKRTVYFFAYCSVAGGKTTLPYVAVNFETATAEVKSVTLNKALTDYGINAVFDDHIYYMNADGINEFSMDGELIKVYPMSAAASVRFFVINDCLMLTTASSTVRCLSWGDKEMYIGHSNYPVGGIFPQPYVAISTRNSSSSGNKPVLAIAADYKATINNLTSPIEKTPEHTLKIVYDITN